MRMRLTCTREEVDVTLAALRAVFVVREASGWCANRREPGSLLGRVYVELETPDAGWLHAAAGDARASDT